MGGASSPLKEENFMIERFSASVASKHMNCTASANLELAIPNWVPPVEDRDADTAANRGTMMHDQFAQVMNLSTRDSDCMAQALTYVSMYRRMRRFKALVEVSRKATWLATSPTTQADLALYLQDEIHIFDLKTGAIPVSARENYQLLYYAATYGDLAPKAKGVYLHIVQPWATEPSKRLAGPWFASADRIQQYMNDARLAEAQIQAGQVVFSPGGHCLFCAANPHSRGQKGRPYCPAMMQVLYPSVDVDVDEVLQLEES
jgi:hypothetical protein